MNHPRLFHLRQRLHAQPIADVAAEVARQLARLPLHERIRPGDAVAIPAGSRGIANLPAILAAVATYLRRLGAAPFLVPAMGSHGGGTVEGQLAVLRALGITEARVGAPIRATMETVVVCTSAEGVPVHFDRFAAEADHVLVVGRVKPHTLFSGEVQSGLVKMLLIGLGKHAGAVAYHRATEHWGFDHLARSVAAQVLQRCRIAGGLAIVEDGYDQTALLEALRPEEIFAREPELLRLAAAWMPQLPFRRADVLLIDEIGKDISGTGMDTNVIGRKENRHSPPDPHAPKIARVIVRGLTEATAGNAAGIGLADLCTRRAAEQVDAAKTAINCITAGHLEAGRMPIVLENDRAVLDAALATIGLVPPAEARMLWIRNTRDLGELIASEAYLPEVRERDDLEALGPLWPPQFDAAGNLLPPPPLPRE